MCARGGEMCASGVGNVRAQWGMYAQDGKWERGVGNMSVRCGN